MTHRIPLELVSAVLLSAALAAGLPRPTLAADDTAARGNRSSAALQSAFTTGPRVPPPSSRQDGGAAGPVGSDGRARRDRIVHVHGAADPDRSVDLRGASAEARLERLLVVGARDADAEARLERRLLESGHAVLVYAIRPGSAEVVLTEVHLFPDGARAPSPALADPDVTDVAEPVNQLESPGSTGRRAAAREIAQSGDPGAAAVLAEALAREEDSAVRESLVRALGRTRSDDAVAPLAQAMLSDDDEGVREAAAEALGRSWSDAAVDPLLQALGDASASVRAAAAEALGRTWSDEATGALIGVAAQDPSAQVREAAIWALSRIGAEAAVAPLIALTDDRSRRVRGAAMQVLASLESDQRAGGDQED